MPLTPPLACPLSDWSTRKLNHSRSSTHSSVSQSVSQPVGPSVSRSVGRGQSCNRSVTHTVCHSVASVGSVTLCHDVSLTQPATLTLCTVCRSVTLYFRSLCHSALCRSNCMSVGLSAHTKSCRSVTHTAWRSVTHILSVGLSLIR